MRIAMVGLRGVPATFGGVERAVEEIGAELVELGHEVVVYCRRGYVDPSIREHRGMQLRHLSSPDVRGLEALMHSGCASVSSLGKGFDIVHFHAMGPGLFTPIVQRCSRARVVQTIHGADDQRAKWSLPARSLLRLGRRFSATVPHATIVVASDLQAAYRREFGRETFYVPNGVHDPGDDVGTDLLPAHGVQPGRYALFVGRLVPEKRPEMLIRAFAQVPGDVRLVFAGGSSHTDEFVDELRALADRDQRVKLPGFVYGQDLQQLYAHAAAFVQPSDVEGMPLTLLEAASHRRPLIASDIPAHTDLIGETGPGRIVFPSGDEAALADALRTVFDNPDAMLRDARALGDRITDAYTWKRIALATEAVYNRVLNLEPAEPVARIHEIPPVPQLAATA